MEESERECIDDSTICSVKSMSTPTIASLPEPSFRATHVHGGWLTCQICFKGCEKRNKRRSKIEKINDLQAFRQQAIRWQEIDHRYKEVYKGVDWTTSGIKWAHRSCKSLFFNDKYLQQRPIIPPVETSMPESLQPSSDQEDEEKESRVKSQLRSSPAKYKYESSWKEPEKKKCIICNGDKAVKGRLIKVQPISTDKAQKTLEEYANIHLRKNNEKYVDGARRILLTLSSKSLLAANVAYHKKQCYEPFRSPRWKREKSTNTAVPIEEDDDYKEIYQLVQVHIINRKEIYTLAQLKSALDEIRQNSNKSPCRSTDLKEKLQLNFGNQLCFHKSNKGGQRSEFVYPSNIEFAADCVNADFLGSGIPKSVALKNAARIIHESINESKENIKWPPTPQDIIESESYVNIDLYNELAWIVNPNGQLDDDGRVQLSRAKATKLVQVAQDIQTLIHRTSPSLDGDDE